LIPEFPPESYSFAITNSEAVDELVDEAAASSAHASSVAVGPNPSIPEPLRPPPRAGKGDHVKWALQALKIADPNFLVGLSEKELCEHVCRKISANFSCAPKTVQRALDDLGWR